MYKYAHCKTVLHVFIRRNPTLVHGIRRLCRCYGSVEDSLNLNKRLKLFQVLLLKVSEEILLVYTIKIGKNEEHEPINLPYANLQVLQLVTPFDSFIFCSHQHVLPVAESTVRPLIVGSLLRFSKHAAAQAAASASSAT